jgi:uncharacterized protein with PQ loop repeat
MNNVCSGCFVDSEHFNGIFNNIINVKKMGDKNKFQCHYEMMPVSRFNYTNNTTPVCVHNNVEMICMTCITFNAEMFVQKFTLTDKFLWVAGERAPLDEPPCGYQNERCSDSDTRLRDYQISARVLGCIFLAAVITTLFVYRKWKVEQEIAGLVWKIDPKDIISMSSQTADGFMDKSTSKVNRIPPFFFCLKLNHRYCCWAGIFLC